MAFEMPPEPEIDTSRAGALSISFEVLHGIMRFPPTVRIASVDIDGPLGSIVLRLEGEPMPLVEDGADMRTVNLVCHEVRDAGGQRSVYLEWSHRPGRWLLHGPEPEPCR